MKTEKITRFFNKVVLTTKKNSPAIFTVVGVVGFVGAGVALYKARPKVEAVVEKVEEKRARNEEIDKPEIIMEATKALALPIGLAMGSAACIFVAQYIQNQRITSLAGALTSSQIAQEKLEDYFREKYGQEAYEEFVTHDIKVTETTNDDGETVMDAKTIRKEIDDAYGAWYSESEEYFRDDHGYNIAYIDSVTASLDLRLFQRGFLLLNEVREKLGLPRTRTGALLGWTTAEYFNIEKIIVNDTDPVTGEIRPNIFVKWTTPKYIYDSVEFGPLFD